MRSATCKPLTWPFRRRSLATWCCPTLHTNDAPSSVTRLIDLGVALHDQCHGAGRDGSAVGADPVPELQGAAGETDPQAWDELVRPFKMKMPETLYQPVGCLECRGTGYRGRMGVYETMPLRTALKNHITRGADLETLTRAALKGHEALAD